MDPDEFDGAEAKDEEASANAKKLRVPVCLQCRTSHKKCDGKRPCDRCLAVGRSHECCDPPTANRKRGLYSNNNGNNSSSNCNSNIHVNNVYSSNNNSIMNNNIEYGNRGVVGAGFHQQGPNVPVYSGFSAYGGAYAVPQPEQQLYYNPQAPQQYFTPVPARLPGYNFSTQGYSMLPDASGAIPLDVALPARMQPVGFYNPTTSQNVTRLPLVTTTAQQSQMLPLQTVDPVSKRMKLENRAVPVNNSHSPSNGSSASGSGSSSGSGKNGRLSESMASHPASTSTSSASPAAQPIFMNALPDASLPVRLTSPSSIGDRVSSDSSSSSLSSSSAKYAARNPSPVPGNRISRVESVENAENAENRDSLQAWSNHETFSSSLIDTAKVVDLFAMQSELIMRGIVSTRSDLFAKKFGASFVEKSSFRKNILSLSPAEINFMDRMHEEELGNIWETDYAPPTEDVRLRVQSAVDALNLQEACEAAQSSGLPCTAPQPMLVYRSSATYAYLHHLMLHQSQLIMHINSAFERAFGWLKSEFRALALEPIHIVHSSDILSLLKCIFQASLRAPSVQEVPIFEGPFKLMCHSGGFRTCMFRHWSIRSHDGTPVYGVVRMTVLPE
eukprot:ANDGO_01146.mRNA.1 hypothetical protein